jgi:salicylate synthetase
MARSRHLACPYVTEKSFIAKSDPVAIVKWLREQGALTQPYYLHVNQGLAEIGWQAQQHIALLDGEDGTANDWVTAIKDIGDQAASRGSKAFGYIGFDAWDSRGGAAPDNSSTFPLVQFFIPKHCIRIQNDGLEYLGADCGILDLARQAPALQPNALRHVDPDVEFAEQDFMRMVLDAKQPLANGLTKVVLSRYLGFDHDADLVDLFGAYCLQQEYADAVLIDFGHVGAAIASPELLVRIEGGRVITNPLAGTKTRSDSPAKNLHLAKALLCDRKELAEHTLALVQMMKELQRHCTPGSLVVNRLLDIIQQKDFMHLSSVVSGDLAAGQHCIDAMLALFPSVMVSGMPKPESIRVIRELEQFSRGLFAGTVGWVAGRDCHFALTIRGIYKYGQRLFVQAGAGVMEESSPMQENEEVRMKMTPMFRTLTGRRLD